MFTFLFDEYKKEARSEYFRKLAVLYLSLALVAAIVACALLVPGFALVASKRNALKTAQSAALAEKSAQNQAIEDEAREVKAKIETLSGLRKNSGVWGAIERLSLKRGTGIALQSIVIARKDDQNTMTISGMADSRDALVAFSKRLQGEPSFSNINLPVSSLAKSKDIPFSLTIDFKP